MAKTEMKTVENPKEAGEILGMDLDEVTTETDQVERETPPKKEVPPAEVTTEVEEPVEKQEMTEEERRTWQGEADRAKAETHQLKEALAQEQYKARLLQEQLKQTLTVVQPFTQKYQAQEEKPPEADYYKDGYFDPQKHSEWLDKKLAYERKQTINEAKKVFRTEQEQMTTQQQVQEVIKEFPEYVNPLTGLPDMERLENDLRSYTGKKSILDLVREAKGKTSSELDKSLRKIEQNASKPASVVASQETSETTRKIDENVQQLQEIFGGYVDLPPDYTP